MPRPSSSATTGFFGWPSSATRRVRSYSRKAAVGREHRNVGRTVGGIGGGEAEVDRVGGAVEADAAVDAEADGAVLLLRIGLGIDHLEGDLAVRQALVGVEHGADVGGVGGEGRRRLQAARHEQPHVDRLVELGEQRLGAARRSCSRGRLGEIDAARSEQRPRQRVDGEIEDDRQDGADGDETDFGIRLNFDITKPQAAFLASTTWTLIQSASTMVDRNRTRRRAPRGRTTSAGRSW